MTLAHKTQKGTRAAAALDGDILYSDPECVASGKNKEEDDGYLESKKKRDKAIAEKTIRTLELTSSNKDKGYDSKEG